jgi:YaiO family outer membrane protein
MTYRSLVLKFACIQLLALTLPVCAADYQKGLRLKTANQLEAAATEFGTLVKENPNNALAVEQLAIVSGWLARYDASIAHWQRLLVLQPKRDDARIGIARVRYWKGEHAEALKVLDDVLSRQPTAADALTLRGDVLLASNQFDAAKDAYTAAGRNGADKAEIAGKLAKIVPSRPWRLDAGFSQDRYDRTRGTEGSAFVQLGYQFSRTMSVYGRYENARQFGTVDDTVFVGGYWRAAPNLQLYGLVGSTANANFRPTSQFLVGAEYLAFKRIQPLLSFGQSTYAGSPATAGAAASGKGNVGTITPGLRVSFPGIADVEYRYAISENINKSITQVSSLRINVDAGEKWAPYLAFYSGEEALPPQAPASFKTIALGATYTINSQWSLRADLSREDRANFYIRNTAGMGLSYLF